MTPDIPCLSGMIKDLSARIERDIKERDQLLEQREIQMRERNPHVETIQTAVQA